MRSRRGGRHARRPRGRRGPTHAPGAPRAAVPRRRARRRLLGSAEYYLGRLAATLDRHDEAERRLQTALEHNHRIGALPRAALCLVHLADALNERGDTARARDTLANAASRAEALDMPALAATATRALNAPL